MAITPRAKIIFSSSISSKKILCPTRADAQITLIRERIDTPKCEQRQSENFHKCHFCIHRGCSPK